MVDNRPLATGFEDDHMARIDTAPAGEVQRPMERVGLKVDSIGPDQTLSSPDGGENTAQRTVKVEVQGEEMSAIPGGARSLDTPEANQAAIEAANQGVADATTPTNANEVIVDSSQEGQGEPVAVNVPTDPNVIANNAIDGVKKTGDGTRTLEEIIGNPAAAPIEPAKAPEISALPAEPEPENAVKMPGGFDPLRQEVPVAAPLSEADPAVVTGEEIVADPTTIPEAPAVSVPQSINMTGLAGTPSSNLAYPPASEPPVAAEPQMPVAPVAPAEQVAPVAPVEESVPLNPQRGELYAPGSNTEKKVELQKQENGVIDEISKLHGERTEIVGRIDKPITDLGSDFARLKDLDVEMKKLLDKYTAIRDQVNKLDNPEAKSGEAS